MARTSGVVGNCSKQGLFFRIVEIDDVEAIAKLLVVDQVRFVATFRLD